MILQQPTPDDYVLATGVTRSVRAFVEIAFAYVDRRIEWRGKAVDEIGVDVRTGQTIIKIDPSYFRPTEVDLLIGDATKAQLRLGWKPRTSFDEMVSEMMDLDLALARKESGRGK